MESFHPTHFTGFWAHLFTPRLEHRLALFLLGGRCPFQSSDVAGKTVSWELWEILVKSTAPEDERLEPEKANPWNFGKPSEPNHHFQGVAGGLSTIPFLICESMVWNLVD